jgi:benzodiazapine receptor
LTIRTLATTTLAVGATSVVGGLASRTREPRWYGSLRKPSYVPPAIVFPIAWTSLYAMIAASSAAAIDRLHAQPRPRERRRYVGALAVKLVLNAAWSWLFFRFHRLGASAFGAAALAASSADLARRSARVDGWAGAALAPYALWCTFATVMSTHIWRLNR